MDVFKLPGTSGSFIPSIFSPFEPECLYLSHAYPTIVLEEQVLITCFSNFTDSKWRWIVPHDYQNLIHNFDEI